MYNLIPSFILEKHKEGKSHGSFKAATMFIDISGFTSMTQELMKNGKEGAEVLNDILNRIFEPVIDAVYDRDGFISTFAGDAFTAIFPDATRPLDSCYAAINIQQIFSDIGRQETRFGEFELSAKIGLSFGKVDWGIVGYKKHKTYFFRGTAIDSCARAEKKCDKMQIIVHKNLFARVSEEVDVEPINKTYCMLSEVIPAESKREPVKEQPTTKNAISKFLPKAVLEYRQKGEFREVVSVFISFKEPSTFDELDRFAAKILETGDNFDGYFEGLNFGDKGGNCLVIFGAPTAYEGIRKRAVDFIEAVRSEFKDNIRAGITFGTVFAGIKGSKRRAIYGVIGDVVNLSARFMMKADWGEIFINDPVNRKIEPLYLTTRLRPRKIKGYAKRIAPYKLGEKKAVKRISFFTGEMVGREAEMNRLTELLQPVTEGKFGGIVYVYGNPGIGKSRLIYELTQSQNIGTLTLQCDSILRKGLNPFAYFLNDYFEQSEARSIDDRKAVFEKIYNELITSVEEEYTKELSRIESIIGSVIGLQWKGSIYEMIDPKDRPTVIQFAIKAFVTSLCRIEPVILQIEDIQWIDDASQEAFQILTRQAGDVPFIILASSRYNDDGSKPVLKADEDVKCIEIILDELQAESIETLIENSLALKPSAELVQYVQSRSEGNPFYIEQFCLYLKENDLLIRKGEFSRLTSEPVDIPVGVNMIIIARIDRLAEDLKETIQIASVLGREFEILILKELIDLLSQTDPGGMSVLRDTDIRPIVSRGEAEKIWSSLTELRYIFSHALLRDAVYEMQLKARLRSLHKLAGDTIVKIYTDDKEKLAETAHHYEQAEDWERAREYSTKTGKYFYESVKYDDAAIYFQKTLSICEKTLEPEHPDLVTCMNDLGVLYERQGLYDKAEELFQKALEIREHVLDDQHPEVAESLSNLSSLYVTQGLYNKAEPLCLRAFKIRESVFSPLHPEYADSLVVLAYLYYKQGLYDKAEPLYKKALEIFEHVFGNQHLHIAYTLNNLALLYDDQGLYVKAESLSKKSLEIRESILGPQHPDVATNLNNLAILYQNQGHYDIAEPLLERALEIREYALGNQHALVAQSLIGLAIFYYNKRLYNRAELLVKRALEMEEKIFGPQHPEVAIGLNNLAAIYIEQGHYVKAKPLYERSLAIREATLGMQHLGLTPVIFGLGKIHHIQGNFKDSETLYQRCINIFEKVAPNHPNFATVYEAYTKLLEKTDRAEEAKKMRERAQAIRNKNKK